MRAARVEEAQLPLAPYGECCLPFWRSALGFGDALVLLDPFEMTAVTATDFPELQEMLRCHRDEPQRELCEASLGYCFPLCNYFTAWMSPMSPPAWDDKNTLPPPSCPFAGCPSGWGSCWQGPGWDHPTWRSRPR